jgi:hypothetical protein
VTRTQDSTAIISSLERVIAAVEGGGPTAHTYQTSMMLVDFPINSAALVPEHTEFLQALHELLLTSPAVVISIIGRASQTGGDANNEALAFDRAETVRAVLTPGLPDAHVGPSVASGDRDPVVNVPGREAELNRSVELVIDWEAQPRQDPTPTGTSSRFWLLDLDLSGSVGVKVVGGRFEVGKLTKLDEAGRPLGRPRRISCWLYGIDYGASFGGPSVTGSIPLSADNGKMTFDGPVDFDWFDGRMVDIVSVGGGLGAGPGFTVLELHASDFFHVPAATATFAEISVGYILGGGVQLMVGHFNVVGP